MENTTVAKYLHKEQWSILMNKISNFTILQLVKMNIISS